MNPPNPWFLILLIPICLLLQKVWYQPRTVERQRRRLEELFYSHCPRELLGTLQVYYLHDGSFERMSPAVRLAFERGFGKRNVRAAMEVLTAGRTSIFFRERDIDPFTLEKGRFQDLNVCFEAGKLASVELSRPYHGCAVSADSS